MNNEITYTISASSRRGPVHIEVKYHKTAKVWEWVRQAEIESEIKKDGVPVVWFRRPREPFRVIVPAKLFMEMYAAWRREQEA